MNTLTIEYPPEVLWALQAEPEEFAVEARLLLALKLDETGKLSTGLAAQVAGVSHETLLPLIDEPVKKGFILPRNLLPKPLN